MGEERGDSKSAHKLHTGAAREPPPRGLRTTRAEDRGVPVCVCTADAHALVLAHAVTVQGWKGAVT